MCKNVAEANWIHRKDYRNSLPSKRLDRGMTRPKDNREPEMVLAMGKQLFVKVCDNRALDVRLLNLMVEGRLL